jgi:hypothetical protein
MKIILDGSIFPWSVLSENIVINESGKFQKFFLKGRGRELSSTYHF